MKTCVEHGLVFAPDCMACEATSADPGYDWRGVAIELSASNARLCDIALKADALKLEVERMLEGMEREPAYTNFRAQLVKKALDAYVVARNGQ